MERQGTDISQENETPEAPRASSAPASISTSPETAPVSGVRTPDQVENKTPSTVLAPSPSPKRTAVKSSPKPPKREPLALALKNEDAHAHPLAGKALQPFVQNVFSEFRVTLAQQAKQHTEALKAVMEEEKKRQKTRADTELTILKAMQVEAVKQAERVAGAEGELAALKAAWGDPGRQSHSCTCTARRCAKPCSAASTTPTVTATYCLEASAHAGASSKKAALRQLLQERCFQTCPRKPPRS